MQNHPTLTNLLDRARRRLFGQLVLDKGALALLIGMGAVILLLLTGTQVLDWYWPVLVAVVSLGIGVYRLRKSLPSLYALAQRIDRRLGLHDSLSTAIHFADHPDPAREAICELQRRDAELVAQRVDLREAVPPSRSRYLLPAAGLALVAFGLFAVRYAVTGSLSLEPSLLKVAYDSFFGPPPQPLAKNQAKRLNMTQDPFDPGNPDAQPTGDEKQPEDLLNPKDSSDAVNPAGDDKAKDAIDKDGDTKGGDSDKQGKDQGDDKDGKQSDKGDKGDKGSKDGQDKEGGDQDKQGNPSESGVLDKIKDALANMLNKMKPNPTQNQQQNAKNQQSQKGDKGEKADQGDKQDSQSQDADANPDNQQSGDQKSDDAKASNQPGKPSSQESASGAGSKDGEKAAKEAKALEAMGQISEILGKRSAAVTGEVMVEVGTTKQSLKTPWADRQAGHSESGGEIHRDEVPLMFQPFVERYFEEIRRTPQTAKPAPAAPKSAKKAG